VQALFVLSCLGLGLFMLLSRVSCRPEGVNAWAFYNASGTNYYAMQYVNNVCETELKVHEGGGWTMLSILLIAAGFGLLAVNAALLSHFNRLHAAARADWGAAAFSTEPPSESEALNGRALFYRFASLMIAAKTVVAAGGCAAFGWYVSRQEALGVGRGPDGSVTGGSLLSRYGGQCDGQRIRWEDAFPGSFRCHMERESAMQYLKGAIYLFGGVFMLVQLASAASAAFFVKAFADDARAEQLEAAAAAAAEGGAATCGGSDGEEGAAPPWRPTADEASLVRALRVALKLGMGFLKHAPREGLPELLAQIIVGKPPSKRDLADMVGHLMSLQDAPSDEVADLLHAVLTQAMAGTLGGGDVVAKDLLRAACIAWSDGERAQYMRGMLDIIAEQERARAQSGPLSPPPARRSTARQLTS
jgi:hypothetical protein